MFQTFLSFCSANLFSEASSFLLAERMISPLPSSTTILNLELESVKLFVFIFVDCVDRVLLKVLHSSWRILQLELDTIFLDSMLKNFFKPIGDKVYKILKMAFYAPHIGSVQDLLSTPLLFALLYIILDPTKLHMHWGQSGYLYNRLSFHSCFQIIAVPLKIYVLFEIFSGFLFFILVWLLIDIS